MGGKTWGIRLQAGYCRGEGVQVYVVEYVFLAGVCGVSSWWLSWLWPDDLLSLFAVELRGLTSVHVAAGYTCRNMLCICGNMMLAVFS